MPEYDVKAELEAARADLSALVAERVATIEECYSLVRRRFDHCTDRAVYRELDMICSELASLRDSAAESGRG